jgi:hypothetical protein
LGPLVAAVIGCGVGAAIGKGNVGAGEIAVNAAAFGLVGKWLAMSPAVVPAVADVAIGAAGSTFAGEDLAASANGCGASFSGWSRTFSGFSTGRGAGCVDTIAATADTGRVVAAVIRGAGETDGGADDTACDAGKTGVVAADTVRVCAWGFAANRSPIRISDSPNSRR